MLYTADTVYHSYAILEINNDKILSTMSIYCQHCQYCQYMRSGILTTSGSLTLKQVPFLEQNSRLLRMVLPIKLRVYAHVYFCRANWCEGIPKLTKIRYVLFHMQSWSKVFDSCWPSLPHIWSSKYFQTECKTCWYQEQTFYQTICFGFSITLNLRWSKFAF